MWNLTSLARRVEKVAFVTKDSLHWLSIKEQDETHLERFALKMHPVCVTNN